MEYYNIHWNVLNDGIVEKILDKFVVVLILHVASVKLA